LLIADTYKFARLSLSAGLGTILVTLYPTENDTVF